MDFRTTVTWLLVPKAASPASQASPSMRMISSMGLVDGLQDSRSQDRRQSTPRTCPSVVYHLMEAIIRSTPEIWQWAVHHLPSSRLRRRKPPQHSREPVWSSNTTQEPLPNHRTSLCSCNLQGSLINGESRVTGPSGDVPCSTPVLNKYCSISYVRQYRLPKWSGQLQSVPIRCRRSGHIKNRQSRSQGNLQQLFEASEMVEKAEKNMK